MLLLLGQRAPKHNPKPQPERRKWYGKKVSAAKQLEHELHDDLVLTYLIAGFDSEPIDSGYSNVDIQALAKRARLSWKKTSAAVNRLHAAGKILIRANPFDWEIKVAEGVR